MLNLMPKMSNNGSQNGSQHHLKIIQNFDAEKVRKDMPKSFKLVPPEPQKPLFFQGETLIFTKSQVTEIRRKTIQKTTPEPSQNTSKTFPKPF